MYLSHLVKVLKIVMAEIRLVNSCYRIVDLMSVVLLAQKTVQWARSAPYVGSSLGFQ
jgi:hypothetical protein